jgi:predicted metal-dependent HD superfamily phosphohydrolase
MKTVFTNLTAQYTSNPKLSEQLWNEIETTYSNQKRYYHNLHHLEHLLKELSAIKEKIHDWDVLLFSLFYHDLVYNPLRRDNEERSIIITENRLATIDVPSNKIDACKKQILATKAHEKTEDNDTNFFIDADLSILGQDWHSYKDYVTAVRKEYALYADNLYYPGRKAVVQHFLKMNRIFITAHFFEKYEAQARQNLLHELQNIEQIPRDTE